MEYGLLSEFSLLNSRTEQTLYCSNSSEFIPYFSQYSNSFWVNLCSWKLYGLVFFSGRMCIVGFGIDWIGISVSSDSPSDKSRFMLFRISTKSMVLLQFNPFSLPTKSKQSPLYSSFPKSFRLYTPFFRSKYILHEAFLSSYKGLKKLRPTRH